MGAGRRHRSHAALTPARHTSSQPACCHHCCKAHSVQHTWAAQQLHIRLRDAGIGIKAAHTCQATELQNKQDATARKEATRQRDAHPTCLHCATGAWVLSVGPDKQNTHATAGI